MAERLQMKDKLNPGTWTVTLSGSISDGSGDSILLTDDSKTVDEEVQPQGLPVKQPDNVIFLGEQEDEHCDACEI